MPLFFGVATLTADTVRNSVRRFLVKLLLGGGWVQGLVRSSRFSAGEQKVLSAGAHIVAPLFIAVYPFGRHHPQGRFMCALTLNFVCLGENTAWS